MAQFPEIGLWRDLLDKVRCRVLLGDDKEAGEEGKDALLNQMACEDASNSVSPWAQQWRAIISDVLPRAGSGALPATDRELRLLADALWRDVADWARKEANAEHHLELFTAEPSLAGAATSEEKAPKEAAWAYLPAMDLLLVVGEGILGITAEGAFTESGPASERRTFAAALRHAKRGSQKRGLAASADQPSAKQAKLNRGPTRIVLLTNLVGAGEVDEDLEEETAEEAAKYGKLVKCIVKEVKGAPDKEAVRIFLEFKKLEAASKAYADMNGRYFGGRTVKARFYDEERYARGDFERRVPSRVLQLTNLVAPDDVDEGLEAETAAEAEKFGRVRQCVVHEVPGAPDAEAVRVYIEFERSEDASKALNAVNGRMFGGREVKARFFEEDKFAKGEL